MELNKKDTQSLLKLYSDRYDEYGYDKKTLGWFKGKQELRFSILTSQIDLEGKSIIDIGCGFGDLNYFLKTRLNTYNYLGIDIVDKLIGEGRKLHPEEYINFICSEYLKTERNESDYILASGIFNYKLSHEDNYQFIEKVIEKAFLECKIGVAFDFLSDLVDFQKHGFSFHSNPSKILSIAFKFSRNVILRNDYAPFEFTIFIFKDDSFDTEDTIFKTYKQNHNIGTIDELK